MGRRLKVLVACERYGRVRDAFLRRGHDAWSCDLEEDIYQPDGYLGPHLTGDVRWWQECPSGGPWDLMIAHPPCTYLSVSGLHWNKRGAMVDGRPRAELTEEALAFVRELMAFPVERIAIENPVSAISTRIRKPDQTFQPYEFGEDASKRTCLWLKNLPPLQLGARRPGRQVEWPIGSGRMVERWANQTDSGQNRLGPSPTRAMERAATYHAVAEAMAEQWGEL